MIFRDFFYSQTTNWLKRSIVEPRKCGPSFEYVVSCKGQLLDLSSDNLLLISEKLQFPQFNGRFC